MPRSEPQSQPEDSARLVGTPAQDRQVDGRKELIQSPFRGLARKKRLVELESRFDTEREQAHVRACVREGPPRQSVTKEHVDFPKPRR